jgi:hypothetical protein
LQRRQNESSQVLMDKGDHHEYPNKEPGAEASQGIPESNGRRQQAEAESSAERNYRTP